MKLLETRMIWDYDEHNAFPDLIHFKDRWYCTVREGACHVGERDGVIRVIVSDDGDQWETASLFKLEGSDLRDPKLSITPSGRLMLLAGESTHSKEKYGGLHAEVSFSDDGSKWSALVPTTPDNIMWLWRVTWFDGVGYGIAYDCSTDDWEVKLYSTENGIDYSLITQLEVTGHSSEATVRFLDDGTMLALVRREANGANGWIGKSLPPYKKWDWVECDMRVSGQDMLLLPNGELCVSTRLYDKNEDGDWVLRTSVCTLNPDTGVIDEKVALPSARDCSYPGMVVYGGELWVTYYSSHEAKTSIYLSKIKLG